MLYPIKPRPVYKDILWGGTRIRERFARKTPFARVAESWELCCRGDGMSVIDNGALAGQTLQEAADAYGEKLLGSDSVKKYGAYFPLLFKIIDANDRLSVQVHPDDAYAKSVGQPNGKNELWYVIDSKPGAKLIYGLREGVTRESFRLAVERGEIAETLNEAPVKPGDVFYIPAGTVHAILDGILVAEIQQNSNTTYRIYDWDRVGADGRGRELQIGHAMNVIRFGAGTPGPAALPVREESGCRVRTVSRCPFFSIDEIDTDPRYETAAAPRSFEVLMNIAGEGGIEYDGGRETVPCGQTLLLPACLGRYALTGKMKVLRTSL